MQRRMLVGVLASTLLALGLWQPTVQAAGLDQATIKKANAAIDKAVAFYRKSQNDDGSFGTGGYKLPLTSLAVAGMLDTKRITTADPMISKAIKFLESKVQKDGGIYEEKSTHKNYETAISLMAFARANAQERAFNTVVESAVKYLKGNQWDKGEKDHRTGGAGYGSHGRPDLSNTTFMLESLRDAGVDEKDPAFQRALLFVRRCQNYAGEGGSDMPNAKIINDGGFIYTPKETKVVSTGETDKGLRSYGSMTYAGLKSFVYAGLKKDDPRVQAALGWIKKNYTLDKNPGVGQQGLFYYYHTFAKALSVMEIDELTDAEGTKHNWREELVTTLLKKQKVNGSWENSNKRWLEGEPLLTTGFVLLALGETLETK